MFHAATTTTDDAIPMDTLIERVADELQALARLARDMPGPAGTGDRETVIAAQSQDLLEQTLVELSRFLRAGLGGTGSERRVELGAALADIRLSALAARLSGAPQAVDARGGDLDLF